MTEWTKRAEELAGRAEQVGHRLIAPTGDSWLLIDQAGGGWSTHDSLDLVEEHLAADEKEQADEEGQSSSGTGSRC